MFIVQLQSKSNQKKYENDFLIIPRDALIRLGIFQTAEQPGKVGTTVPCPNYHKGNVHPLFKYWNKWDLLNKKKDKLDCKELREKYTSLELETLHTQEHKERLLHLGKCLSEAESEILSLKTKINDENYEKIELEYLNSTLVEKMTLYENRLRNYLEFHGYGIHKLDKHKKFTVCKMRPKQARLHIGICGTITESLKMAKTHFFKNEVEFYLPLSSEIVMSYAGIFEIINSVCFC
jgi:hypothetical protein